MPAEILPRGVSVVYRTRRGREVKLYQVRVGWQGKRELVGRFDTLRDAKTALLLAQADILRGIFIPPSAVRRARREAERIELSARLNGYKVKDLARDWLDHVRRMGRKESTLYTYSKRIEGHILPELGELPVEAITPQLVQAWFDALDSKHGNGVSRGTYMMLAGMFTFATGQARGQSHDFAPLVERSPCRVAGATVHKPVKPSDAAHKVIDAEQVADIARNMPDREALAVLLGGHLALRIGEVLGLQRGDVVGEWLHVARQLQSRGAGLRVDTPKSDAGRRELPIPPDLAAAVRRHLERFVGEGRDAPLFPREARGAQHTHPNTLRKHFRVAVEQANVDRAQRSEVDGVPRDPIPSGFVFHSLRHTALTRLGERGATAEELKAFGGHRDAATVQRYQHATRSRLASLAALLVVSVPDVA